MTKEPDFNPGPGWAKVTRQPTKGRFLVEHVLDTKNDVWRSTFWVPVAKPEPSTQPTPMWDDDEAFGS